MEALIIWILVNSGVQPLTDVGSGACGGESEALHTDLQYVHTVSIDGSLSAFT